MFWVIKYLCCQIRLVPFSSNFDSMPELSWKHQSSLHINVFIVAQDRMVSWNPSPWGYDKEPLILYIQYHGYWCPGDILNQGFSYHNIVLVLHEYSSFSKKVHFYHYYSISTTLIFWFKLKHWGPSQHFDEILDIFSSTKVFDFLMNFHCHVHVSELVS